MACVLCGPAAPLQQLVAADTAASSTMAAHAAVASPIKIDNKSKLSFKDSYDGRYNTIPETPRGYGNAPTRFVYDKLDQKDTYKRAEESVKRLRGSILKMVENEEWSPANAELRNQLNTLRYDINNLTTEKGFKKDRNKQIFTKLDALDYSVRQKQGKSLALIREIGDTLEVTLKELK